MNEILSIEEIQARYEAEWVLIEDPETNNQLEVLAGKVLWHGKERDEVYRKGLAFRPKRSAIVYPGSIPEETAVVL